MKARVSKEYIQIKKLRIFSEFFYKNRMTKLSIIQLKSRVRNSHAVPLR